MSNNPVSVSGFTIVGTNPAKVATALTQRFAVDAVGRQIVVMGHERTLTGKQSTTITTTTETTIVTAGAAGIFNDLTQLTLMNTSATASVVSIREATAGTVIMQINVPAGGTVIVPFQTPFIQATAANAWTATLGTAVTSMVITAQFIRNT